MNSPACRRGEYNAIDFLCQQIFFGRIKKARFFDLTLMICRNDPAFQAIPFMALTSS